MEPSNILRISSLGDGWCDKDHLLLHACFQLLTDFVEQEMSQSWWVKWNETAELAMAKKEIDELYDWWKLWSEKLSSRGYAQDDADYEEENRMLKKLIDVRK